MKKSLLNGNKATLLVTIYLVIYTVCWQMGTSWKLIGIMFLMSPFLVMWMVYAVLKQETHPVRELKDDEEWGYSDRDSSTLGVF